MGFVRVTSVASGRGRAMGYTPFTFKYLLYFSLFFTKNNKYLKIEGVYYNCQA
jgi:hypothetical protein